MRNVNGCLQFLRNVFEGGTKNILAAAKCHPEEVAALYTLLRMNGSAILTGADSVMDGGVSGLSGDPIHIFKKMVEGQKKKERSSVGGEEF